MVAAWIEEGRTPYVFMHSPYDVLAPRLARAFHRLLCVRVAVGEMTAWPGEQVGRERTAAEASSPFGEQLALF